jgi:hypothetical protein
VENRHLSAVANSFNVTLQLFTTSYVAIYKGQIGLFYSLLGASIAGQENVFHLRHAGFDAANSLERAFNYATAFGAKIRDFSPYQKKFHQFVICPWQAGRRRVARRWPAAGSAAGQAAAPR